MTDQEIRTAILNVCKVANWDGDFNVVGFHALCDKLKQLAVMDELTGLYNLRGFLSVAGKQIERTRRKHEEIVLVYLDLDHLKRINDDYGHSAGDAALKALAEILVKVFRKTDIIGRLGGDEFTVLAIDCSMNEYRLISDRMDECVRDLNENGGHEFTLSVTHGATPYAEGSSDTLKTLMDDADTALRRKKRSGR